MLRDDIPTPKLSLSSYPIVQHFYSHMTLGKILHLRFFGIIKVLQELAVVGAPLRGM